MEYPSAWLQGASLGERIACELRLQIIKGTLKQGTILSENQLAGEFGTSRSPVREALKVLSNEGLIRLERMGPIVLGLTAKDIEELNDVRFLIENFVLQRLAKKNQDNLVKTLHQTIRKMELAAEHEDYIEFSYQDLYFHEQMIKETDHTRILHLWNGIRHIVLTALFVATKRRFTSGTHELNPSLDQHRFIADALASRDPETIKQIVLDHFADTRRTVSDIIVHAD
ncbi:GntR family transcriptional regulator [bacterium LRH843]|nr:GntR family transcriptional regulator [bacterium LRH843]